MGILDILSFKAKEQSVPDESGIDQVSGNSKSGDIFKAYIPNFLYKPPFGMPRRDNPVQYKELSKNPYVFSVIKTLADEATSNEWSINEKEEFQSDNKNPVDYTEKIKEITQFFNNPNGNNQSFKHLLRQLVTDILEVDAGVLVKVFNRGGKMSQIFARDGSLFLKNPDIYGYMGNRADFVLPLPDGFTSVGVDMTGPGSSQQQIMKQYSLLYKDQAAYFQYGWTAGSMPVPFGKREIVYMMQNPRGDSIYGQSPIEKLREIILSLIYGAEYNLDFYTNNNMPDGVIQILGGTREHLKQFRANWDNQFKTTDKLGNKVKRFFRIPLSTQEVKFTPFQLSSKEMEIIQQQQWFSKILWMSFGVTAEEMGFTEDSNKATSESQIQTFKRKAIKPLLDVIQYHINTQLLPEFFATKDNCPDFRDVPLEFVFDDYNIEEDIKELTKLQMEINMGIKTAEMVALERGIDVEELKKQKEEAMDKEAENNIKQNPGFQKEEEEEKESVYEEKSLNPLKQIDSYIDEMGREIINAVGNLNETEIKYETGL